MVLEADTGRCASEEAELRMGVDMRRCASKDAEPQKGWIERSHIHCRRERVSARTMGPERGGL